MESELKLRKQSKSTKEIQKNEKPPTNQVNEQPKIPQLKYGPMPKFSGQRIFSRAVIIVAVLIYVWYYPKNGKEVILAQSGDVYTNRGVNVNCDKAYLEEIKSYSGCVPKKCGRFVMDRLVTEYEADILLWLAKRGMSLAESSGGATIMDLHSGALSYKTTFINFYKSGKDNFITPTDLLVYRTVRERIQAAIAETFGLDGTKLYLTYPTFFSKLTNKEPAHVHDEYWHVHVDKFTYESFHYTSLVYLNNYRQDFQGGRFLYLENTAKSKHNMTVEPRKGRVSFFTSGAENPHFVEKVTEGERFAITISFTCDESKKIKDLEKSLK